MPIPNRDQWRRVMMATQRVPPPGEGLVEQRAPRLTAYQGFVRVIGHPLAYGWQLGLVTEYDEELDQFVDRGDVPVWVRTPSQQSLEVGQAGGLDGLGVYWGRAQGSVQVSTVVGTGTGSITGASGTGSGDTQTLPVYIVGPGTGGPGSSSGGATTFNGSQVSRSGAQTISHATLTAVSFNTEDYDTNAYWVLGNPTRLTIPSDGYYAFGAAVRWQASGLGTYRQVQVGGTLSSVSRLFTDTRPPIQPSLFTGTTTSVYQEVHGEALANVGEYVEVNVLHDADNTFTGVSLDILEARFWIHKLGNEP